MKNLKFLFTALLILMPLSVLAKVCVVNESKFELKATMTHSFGKAEKPVVVGGAFQKNRTMPSERSFTYTPNSQIKLVINPQNGSELSRFSCAKANFSDNTSIYLMQHGPHIDGGKKSFTCTISQGCA